MKILPYILLFSAVVALGQNDNRNRRNKGAGVPDKVIEAYTPASFHGMPYRFLLPDNYDPSKSYPMILSLHGRAGIGDDNRSQFRNWTAVFVDEKWRKKYPCIVVAPQSWDSWLAFNERAPARKNGLPKYSAAWEKRFAERGDPSEQVSTGSLTMAYMLVDEMSRRYSVDKDRIYVLGHSMGGHGSWNAIWHAPNRFAAAIPSAGGLAPWHDPAKFKDVPIWAFHGDVDPTVPVEFTREIFEKLKKAGGNMKYTELGGVKHNASSFGFYYKGDDSEKKWKTHYSSDRCDKTEDVWDWLFRQKR